MFVNCIVFLVKTEALMQYFVAAPTAIDFSGVPLLVSSLV